ncbi:complement regulator-acquiring protein [Borrelia parkeri]|uniref:complement regulator-acquiring protein n=1 Tax=Borrelia parkeri TaxID=141 RepID=UPI00046D8893|nr:complement regulator-acquiring protein [Borrelia parkeri]UPA11206.1 complement regulator-acquiring protein [Borrelia parkeri]
MKNKIFIMSFITIFTLTTCNSDLELFPKTGIVGLRRFLASLEPESIKKAKNDLINTLSTKAYNIKPILDLHNNDTWIEDSTQFGLKGNGKAFDKIDNKMNNQKASDTINKPIRRKFYLSLEYDEILIRDFGAVLNQIAATTTHKNNAMLTTIINATITYSSNYFEIAFTLLINKEKQLQSLNFNALQFLKEEFDKLERIKQNWKQTVKNITNDYIKNKNNIKTDKTKIVTHIIRNYKLNFTTAFNKIDTINNNIAKILGELK